MSLKNEHEILNPIPESTTAYDIWNSFIEVEKGIISLIEKDDGKWLFNTIRGLSYKRENLKEIEELLKKEFNNVIKHLKNKIATQDWFVWCGYLLWDGFNEKLSFLGRCPSDRIDQDSYNLISDFIESPFFRQMGFKEIMSDLVFSKNTKVLPLIVEWIRPDVKSKTNSSDIPKINDDVVICSFNFLNKIIDSSNAGNEFKILQGFVNTMSKDTVKPKEQKFSCIAGRIDSFCNSISQAVNESNVFKENIERLKKYEIKNNHKDIGIDFTTEDILKTLIVNRLFDDKWQYLYFIPARLFERRGVGGFVIATRLPLSEVDYFNLSLIANRIFGVFALAFSWMMGEESALTQARRVAVAAITGRNTSHTIGSHALSYLTEERILSNYSYKEISKFFEYLQGRMDYIAEISTAEPQWTETLEFRKDILEPFIKQFVLLDNINKSVYTQYNGEKKELNANKLAFILKIETGATLFTFKYEYIDNILRSYKKGEDSDGVYTIMTDRDKAETPDVQIECPHGIVGKHAFYTFLENFIRNSAKHGGARIDEILREGNKRLEIIINLVLGQSTNEWPADLIQVRVSDNLANYSENIYKDVNQYIEGVEKEFITPEGNLRGGAWGIYEMRIAVGWLLNAKINETILNLKVHPILKLVPPDGAIPNITYEFHLLRSLDMLIVSNISTIEESSKGIDKINNLNELEKYYKSGNLRHKFILIDINDTNDVNWLLEPNNQIKLPLRTLLFCDDTFVSRLQALKGKFAIITSHLSYNMEKKSPDEYKSYLYEKFINWLNNTEKISVLPQLAILNHEVESYSISDLKYLKDGAIFLIHGFKSEDKQNVLSVLKDKGIAYFQPISTAQAQNIPGRKLAMYKSANDQEKKAIIWELYELGLTKVLIADERVYKKITEKEVRDFEGIPLPDKFPLWQVWKWMGVEIIDIKEKNGELKILKCDQNEEMLESFFNRYPNYYWTHFLVHQGIIDSQIGKEKFRYLDKLVKDKCRNIIIHSGRGQVKVEKNFKFLELSNLENYITNNPTKWKLIALLAKIVGGKERK
jgi:hypothetical protein